MIQAFLAFLRRRTASRRSEPEQSISDDPLTESIQWVAAAIEIPEFSRRAQALAEVIGPQELARMERQIHARCSPPDHLQQRFSGLGQWMAARQFALFEVLFFVGEPALPLLRKVAFGPYDWSQGNAIEVLCRLAAKGLAHDETVRSLKAAAPTFREEALLYALGPLKRRAASDGDLQKVMAELNTQPEFQEAYDGLPVV